MGKTSPLALFFAGLILLAGGIILGFVLGSQPPAVAGSHQPPMQLAPAAGPAMASPAPWAESAHAPVSRPDGEAADSSLSRSSGWSDALVESTQSEVAAQRFPTGTGSITGRVSTSSGSPLSGVEVVAIQVPKRSDERPTPSLHGLPPSPEHALRRELRRAYARYNLATQTTRKTHTDAAGTFELQGIADARYRVQAFSKGFAIAVDRRWRSTSLGPGDRVEFIATSLAALEVHMKLPDGSQPPYAWVQCERTTGSRNSNRMPWSPEEPLLYLKPGGYQISASVESGARYHSEPTSTVIEKGVKPPALTLQLTLSLELSGRLLLAAEEEIGERQLRVYALPFKGDTPPDFAQQRRDAKRADLDRRSKHWDYRFEGLEPGAYLLTVTGDENSPLFEERIALSDRSLEHDLSVPPMAAEGLLTLWVYGPEGQLVQDASARYRYQSSTGSGSSSARLTLRSDGSYRMRLNLERKEVGEDARFTLQVDCSRYGSKEIGFDPRNNREVSVSFSAPSMLEVTIPAYQGSPYEGRIYLKLSSTTNDGRGERQRQVASSRGGLDANGRKVLGPLQPGEYQLAAEVRGNGFWGNFPAVTQPLELSPGMNRATLNLPPLYHVTVRVEGEAKGANIMVSHSGTEGRNRMFGGDSLDAEGKVRLGPLPAGEYTVHLHHRELNGQMSIHLPGPSEVLFRPEPRKTVDAFRIQISSNAGYLASLGLRSGDLLVGINDIEFKDRRQMQTVYDGALYLLAKPLVLRILRNGIRLAVSADPKQLKNRGGLGGSLRPASR